MFINETEQAFKGAKGRLAVQRMLKCTRIYFTSPKVIYTLLSYLDAFEKPSNETDVYIFKRVESL